MRKFLSFAIAVTFVLAATAGLCADPPKKEAQAKAAPATKGDGKGKEEEKGADNVRMGEVEIRGEYENPDVFYIIPRRKAQMDTGTLTMDYSSEIMAPIIPHVFEAQHAKENQKEAAGAK